LEIIVTYFESIKNVGKLVCRIYRELVINIYPLKIMSVGV